MQPSGRDGIHLTYCSNIHPGEEWHEIFQQLDQHVPDLKRNLGPDAPFGLGLRLGRRAAEDLIQPEKMRAFQRWLSQEECYVFTINGFPYGSFHGGVVKDQVYAPDWRSRKRVDYTLRLVEILADLLPEGREGSISTSPISYKPWLNASEREEAFRQGAVHLAEVTSHLVRLRADRGIFIHLGIEPEPDCLIENTAETVAFFEQWLLHDGTAALMDELGCGRTEAEMHLRDHVRVCYDTCHFAVEYEQPAYTFHAFEEAGIKLSKVQLSAALKIDLDNRSAQEVVNTLRPFAESTYLHQVIERHSGDRLRRYPDLPQALDQLVDEPSGEWRIHYHVPLFVDTYGELHSTQHELAQALDEVLDRGTCSHFELETYTWDVLPESLQMDLGRSVQREFDWVLSQVL